MPLTLSKKQEYYRNILSKTLYSELYFLIEVAHGRAQGRETIEDKITKLVFEGIAQGVGQLAGPLGSVAAAAIQAAVTYILGAIEKKDDIDALYHSLMTTDKIKLELLINQVAQEAACRYEIAITRIADNDAINKFAITGTIRILDYITNKKKPLNSESLLFGLIAGRSGSGYQTIFHNTQIPVEKNATLSAEGLYGRTGYLIPQNSTLQFYVPEEELNEDDFKYERNEHKRDTHYGYVKYTDNGRGIEGRIPKTGYVQLPTSEILTQIASKQIHGYDFVIHTPHRDMLALVFVKPNKKVVSKLKARYITNANIEEYLKHIQKISDPTKVPTLNQYLGSLVFFRGRIAGTSQSPLDLSKAKFSGSDFSEAILEHCTLGSCEGTYLTGATLKHVKATGTVFNNAHLDLTICKNCNFDDLAGLQSSWQYATIKHCSFKNVIGIGMKLEGTNLDGASKKSFIQDWQKRISELQEQHLKHNQDIKIGFEQQGHEIKEIKSLEELIVVEVKEIKEDQNKIKKRAQNQNKALKKNQHDIYDIERGQESTKITVQQHEQAISELKQQEEKKSVLPILMHSYGGAHDNFFKTLKILGITSLDLKDSKKQKDLLDHAVAILEKYCANKIDLAIVVSNFGNACGAVGNAEKQKILLEHALAILEKHYGKDNVNIASTLGNLSNAYGDLGDAKKQKDLLIRALEIQEEHCGKEHVNVSVTLESLGDAYGSLGDWQRQRDLLERALRIQELHNGEGHINVASILEKLGCVYETLDIMKSKTLLDRALDIQEKCYGKTHVKVASTLAKLGSTYETLGDAEQSKSLLERALNIEELYYTKDHIKTASTLVNLGIAYGDLGDVEKKKNLLSRALIIQKQYYGENHINVGATLANLASAYEALGNSTQSKELLECSIKIHESYYGKDHPRVKTIIRYMNSLSFQSNNNSSVSQISISQPVYFQFERALRYREKYSKRNKKNNCYCILM